MVHDPNLDGPYQYAELDATFSIPATGDSNRAIHCAYPTSGPSAGPYPVIVFGHGFSIDPSEYYSYVRRLASFGYVAMTIDFPGNLLKGEGVNNVSEAKDLLAGVDWAKGNATLGSKVDANTVGTSGHSLGGKVALLAATMDSRVKASFTLDPVNASMNCSATDCPNVIALMPSLHIPTGFIGETTDAAGGFMPCAPASDNYQMFYGSTNSPSLAVTANGANHVSFVDNLSTCGLACAFCQPATAPQMQVHDMALAYTVAFYERYLRGDTGYDTYLTGAQAQARYVSTNEATITSK
jgi:hypothetical protein